MEGKETDRLSMSLTAGEIKDYIRSHSAEQIQGETDEFISHVQAMCRSMSDLWKEYCNPLFICGVHLEVSIYSMGQKIQEMHIGNKESLLDNLIKEKMEGFKDGAGE